MLVLGSKTITVDGVTVFADHADPNQFWYLPGPVELARRGGDKRGALSLIIYKPAAVAAGVKGGGFLTFETDLKLSPERERKILSQLSALSLQPRLAAVPFDRGTVKCVALNLEGAVGGRNILLDGDRAHHDIFLAGGGAHKHRRNRLIESGEKTGFRHLLLVG